MPTILPKCVWSYILTFTASVLNQGCQVGIARAARTDAGVHAAGNVVSLKMIISIPGVDDLIASINEQLPPAIRVWGYVSFHDH
jgi:tRNA pseudouridine(38-40) synthase